MLVIKAPIDTVLKPDFIHTSESFVQRITANYQQMRQQIVPEDLMHIVTQPPEVFVMGGDTVQMFNQTNVTNMQMQKVEVLNQLLNRIMIAADGHMTYQDEVYISNTLHKLGIRNDQAFMRQVFALTEETKNTNQLLSTYQSHVERLSALINEYQSDSEEVHTSISNEVQNEILHLHEEVFRRWQSGDLYRMQQNFRYSRQGDTIVNEETFRMAEQIRLSQNLALQDMRQAVRGEFVPLVYHHENIFEGDDVSEVVLTENAIQERIASAVLLNLVDNLYQSTYDRVDHRLENWFQTAYTFYRAGDNVFERMEQNSHYRQLLYEENHLNQEQQRISVSEQHILEQLLALSQQQEWHTHEALQQGAVQHVDLTLATTQEENEEVTENLTERNTIEQQLFQQNLRNERIQQEYLTNLANLVEEYRETPVGSSKERTQRDMLFALEHPEEFRREYSEETKRQEERARELEQRAIELLPEPQRQMMELVRTYLREPQRLIESNLISNNDLTLLYYDTMAGEVDNPRIEREMERVSRERLREQERLIREIRGEQEAAEGADRSPESAAAAGEEAVGRDTLIYRDSRERSTETTDLVRESQTLIERQQEYNRIIRDVVSQAYEAEEERRYAAGGIGEGPGTDEGDLPLIYREEEEVPESEESIASRTEEILERRRVYNEIVERVKREQEAGEAVPGEEVISPEEAAHRTEFALTYRDVSDRTEAVEQIETQTQEIIERQNNVNQVIEEIRNQPTESVREAPTAREHVWFVHRSTQNTIDEETIEELRESLRHQESQTTQTTESFHNVENVEHRTVEGTTRQVISREDQNEEITEIVNRSLRGRLDEISNRVYGRIEKQLNSERRRRGL